MNELPLLIVVMHIKVQEHESLFIKSKKLFTPPLLRQQKARLHTAQTTKNLWMI